MTLSEGLLVVLLYAACLLLPTTVMVQVEPICLMFVVHVVNNCKTKHRYLDIWDAALS